MHGIIFRYFHHILTKELVPSRNVADAVDQLLDVLVREFDAEELPLRREERFNQLIIQTGGDRDAAQQLFDHENVVEEKLDFAQLLTNFAMYPNESKASLATQKLAVALSKEWIVQAHDDLTAENRHAVPDEVAITLDDWTGISRDGGNEEELFSSLEQHIQKKKKEALKANGLRLRHWIALAAGVGFFAFGFGTPFLFLCSAIGLTIFLENWRRVRKNANVIAQNFAELLENHKQVLAAALSDLVDYRREYEAADADAAKIRELLEPVTPEQYVYSSYDAARTVIL